MLQAQCRCQRRLSVWLHALRAVGNHAGTGVTGMFDTVNASALGSCFAPCHLYIMPCTCDATPRLKLAAMQLPTGCFDIA